MDFGIQIGAGVKMSAIVIDLRYGLGLTDLNRQAGFEHQDSQQISSIDSWISDSSQEVEHNSKQVIVCIGAGVGVFFTALLRAATAGKQGRQVSQGSS